MVRAAELSVRQRRWNMPNPTKRDRKVLSITTRRSECFTSPESDLPTIVGGARREPTDETSTRMTTLVIKDVNAGIIGIVEAEDRSSLAQFKGLKENQMFGPGLLD
jgi:hypothetical protein